MADIPLEQFYNNENEKVASENLPVQTFRNDPNAVLTPNPKVASFSQTNPPTRPGFFSSLSHGFKSYNEGVLFSDFVSREAEFAHPLDEDVPDDFNPRDPKFFEGYDNRYWGFLSEATGPKEMQARQAWVLNQMQEDERFANGSFAGELIGGFLGALTSPSTYLIPFSQTSKYATISQNVIRNTVKAAPSIALQTIAHEGFNEATSAASDFHDLAVNTLRDTAFGLAFLGGASGLGAAVRGGKIYNARKTVNFYEEGIDFNPKINEKGELLGYEAQASPGFNVNAAKVNLAQQFVDSAMAQTGLFAIPFVSKLAGNKLFGSPIVRGLTNRFASVREFTDRMASHSIVTERLARGIAKEDSAEDIIKNYQAGAINFTQQYKNFYYQENGIDGGDNIKNATKMLMQRFNKGPTVSEQEFGFKVRQSIITGEKDESKAVNDAVSLTRTFIDEVYQAYRKASGFDERVFSPQTAVNYLMRNYNVNEITKNPDKFIELTAAEFKRQDEIINQLSSTQLNLESNLKKLLSSKSRKKKSDATLDKKIRDAETALNKFQRDLESKVFNDENFRVLIEDRNFLSLDDIKERDNLFKPIDEANAEAEKLNVALKGLQKRRKKAKDAEIDILEKEIEKTKTLFEETKRKADDLLFELEDKALRGEIKRTLFSRDSDTNQIRFRTKADWLKLRAPHQSDNERISQAFASMKRIENETPEQISQTVLGSLFPSLHSNPLRERSLLVPDRIYNEAGFLDNDIPKNVTSYTNTLGRHIALRERFGDLNFLENEKGPIGLVRALEEEHDALRDKILKDKTLNKKQRDKELLKLKRDLNESTKFMRTMMDIFMGRSNHSKEALRFTRAVRNFAAATKLGGVPIAQVTDLGAIVLKNNLWPVIRSGLIPFFKTANGLIKSEEGKAWRENAAHALVSIQHVGNGYMTKFWDNGSMTDVPVGGKIESALENIAHMSGNLFGTNYIENGTQRIVANVFQSEVMKAMFDFKNGSITEKQLSKMLNYGIDPKLWADRFIEGFKQSNGFKELGGYQSYYWRWKDSEAVERMGKSIQRAVFDTVVQRGLFTSPFWTNNPVLGMIFMFHGWAFSAFTRYTVPILQRPDAEKLLGMAFMLGLGALTDPLRNLANGKPFELEDDTWFWNAFNAFSNSGVGGIVPDMIQITNKLVGGSALPKSAQTVRFQGINRIGAALGPAGGIAEDIFRLIQMGLTGKINQQDIKRGARLVPFSSMIGVRALTNHFIESFDIPKTTKDAEPYSWRK